MLTAAQKKYQSSLKGIEARRKYMEKRKARLAIEKAQKEEPKKETANVVPAVEITKVELKLAKPLEDKLLTPFPVK